MAFLLLLLVFSFAFFGFVFGARKYLFFLYFGLLAVWLLRWGIGGLPKFRAAVILALLLAFFAFWGTVRARPMTEIVGAAASDPARVDAGAYHMGYFKSVAEPFEVASIVVGLFPSQEPYRYGGTLLVTLLGFIPRAVWPGKPVGLGKELTIYTDGVYYDPRGAHSVTPTILGDCYANLGVSGVLIGGLLLGVVMRTATCYAVSGMVGGRQRNAARVLLPAVFLASLSEVRGDLGAVLAFCVMTGVPVVATLGLFHLDDDPDSVEASRMGTAGLPAAEPA
jgi:oligosaccharide repeat unit polymerase